MIDRSTTNTKILSLLRKLKKDTNWLLNLILDSKDKTVASTVNTQMTAEELLKKCSDEVATNILFELKGIEKRYETEGYPMDFQFIPEPEIWERPEEHLMDYLMKLDLTASEARVFWYLLTHGNSTASDVSRATGIQRTETYNYLSTLLAKGIVFSTFDRPQKYYSLSTNEAIGMLIQAKRNALKEVKDRFAKGEMKAK